MKSDDAKNLGGVFFTFVLGLIMICRCVQALNNNNTKESSQ